MPNLQISDAIYQFTYYRFLGLEDDTPPQQGTPPTAYMGHGSDMKFGMDVSIDNNFVTIRADFGISIFELSNSAK